MLHVGQLTAWPILNFVANRMAIEKVIEQAREATRPESQPLPTPMPDDNRLSWNMMGEDDLQALLDKAKTTHAPVQVPNAMLTPRHERPQFQLTPQHSAHHDRSESPSFSKRFSGWLGALQSPGSSRTSTETVRPSMAEITRAHSPSNVRRRGSVMEELKRQTGVFWDDPDAETTADEDTTEDEVEENAVLSEQDIAPFDLGDGDDCGTVSRRKPQGPQITFNDQSGRHEGAAAQG